MTEQVPLSALSKLHHVDPGAVALGGIICTATFYIEGKWELWFPAGDQLHCMHPIELGEGIYFGAQAAEPRDLRLATLELIGQHACRQDTGTFFKGICDDIYNIAASLAKLDLITLNQVDVRDGASRMALTEVEYLAIQCRSIFDYLQGILRSLWSSVRFSDGSVPKKTLPESFREVVMDKREPRTAEAIMEKYQLLPALAKTYSYHASFFASLRVMRDAIVHQAGASPLIFMTDKGPCIHANLWPFSTMLTWKPEEYLPNNIVPLKPALGAMIYRTLLAAEDLISTFASNINLGPPICPKLALFLRSWSGSNLMDVLQDAHQRQDGGAPDPQPDQ